MTLRVVFRLSLFLLFASALFSCNTCSDTDSLVSQYYFESTVVDEQTGENLISGDSPQLDPDGFQLYSMRGSERIFHELYPGNQAIYADIRGHSGDLYLEYPDGNIDTLQAFFSQRETECWGRIERLEELIRNGSETFTDIYTVLEFRY